MISFTKLGEYGRLGNQIFQYAFMRTHAKKLRASFYVPKWKGDAIFLLNDENERCEEFSASNKFIENSYVHGFNKEAIHVGDDTDIAGYFQSYKFFNKEDVMKWFSFNEEYLKEVRTKYLDIDFTNTTALHVRLGDYLHPSLMFYAPTLSYFKNALTILKPEGKVLIFSEDSSMAKKYLGEVGKRSDVIFIEGNKDYEDFYLMSLCKDIVCSPSTFSWWAAYLNKQKYKRIIMPESWFLPMCRVKNNDIFVEGWIRLKAHRTFLDNYYVRYVLYKLKKFLKL